MDVRVLADMRSRLLGVERESPGANNRAASLAEDLAKAKATTKRFQEEAKRLREELGKSRQSVDELVIRMRMMEADAISAAQEIETLEEEIRRMKESKAWRAVSRYRRTIKWLGRRGGNER